MQTNLQYFKIVALPLLLLLSCGRLEPNNQRVTINAQVKSNDKDKYFIEQLNIQAIAQFQQDQLPDAIAKLQQALSSSRTTKSPFWEAVTLNNIGRVHQHQGEYSLALQAYLQAVVINREIGDRVQLGKTYSNIGQLFKAQQQPELAIFFYKHCLINRELARLQPSVFSLPQPDAYSITVAQTYRLLGENLLKQGRVTEAQRAIDLLKVEELQEYLQNVPGNQRTAKGINIVPGETAVKQKLEQTLDNAVELGKELNTLRKITPQARSPQQKQRLQELVTQQQQQLEDFNTFLTSPAITAQLQQISRTARQQNLDLESINALRDDLARLPQKSAIIYPLVLKDSLELVLVTPESPPIHRTVAVSDEKLNQTITAFRQALTNPSRDIKTPARQLHNWLIKPLETELKQAGTQTILYAPDGKLRYVPLSALHNGKQWLVEGFNVNHITAASLTSLNTPRQQDLRILAGAFTQGNYQVALGNRHVALSGLPFAGIEVKTLASTFPQTKTLLDQAFSPEVTVPQMDDYTIVHLATHAAFVVGKPEDSFILFGNGDRVNLTNIATWSLPRVDLVVLSACETGLGGKLGNGQEILGFGYQIQRTGAKSAIASLWTVDDGGTQVLMSAFYDQLARGDITKTTALQKAQIALIKGDFPANNKAISAPNTGSLNHPYYWASFILIGNGL
ncbi:CHAT domain-containing protein [Anabaena sp. UHCC 0399]|uniref:CHAT domain-containing protein n=1 Tax=Anabaena sp. UHCC 0399 TaxID=3110238 RepID=UPI002B21D441|nr:CHAT domain-containing protein [Anabaena sp. UHCC 0399]MEA5566958.1 CHAT domain-containing protein [Anabaena sp. UHCC 0399]